jgi:hypothetical protein
MANTANIHGRPFRRHVQQMRSAALLRIPSIMFRNAAVGHSRVMRATTLQMLQLIRCPRPNQVETDAAEQLNSIELVAN